MTAASRRIQQEATQWVVRSDLGPLTAQERARLDAWLDADPRHRGAFVRASSVRVAIERISALSTGVRSKVRASRTWLHGAMAASIAVIGLLATLGWFVSQGGDRYSSDVGEIRRVALDDGSSIFLNTATQALVRFDRSAREVDLPHGEALFEVAKDKHRPFVVRAGNVSVMAVGTSFSVRHERGRVEITVTEGVVEVMRDGAPAQRLAADHYAVIAQRQPMDVRILGPGEAERQLAWRTGWLEFDGQTLREAVAQMNRNNRRQILIADDELASSPIVGVFSSIDLDGFAQIVAAGLDARAVIDGDTIRLERK